MKNTRMPHPDALLSVEEAAQMLGLAEGTLRNWLSARRLSFVKVGSLTKLSRRVLERYVEQNTVEAVNGD
jgi:excisionase family DNA binding protein